jgi:hypothetical protein
MYTKGPATGLSQAFIDYMTSPDAITLSQQQDFVPITQMSPAAITAHNAVP